MKANKFIKEEDAVSPVIGVILMVAITVILAAVIGAFVFGMGSSLSRTYSVGATVSQSGVGANTVTVVFTGGPDATEVTSLAATSSGVDFTIVGTGFANGTVGSYSTGAGTAGHDDHIILVATFADGTSQVILNTYV